MKKSIGSRSLPICLRFAVFVLTLVIASSAVAQNLGKRRSPDSTKPDQIPPDPDGTSQHNALAMPDDESAGTYLGREPIQESDALPRTDINKLIVQMIEKMPKGGEYRASSESTAKLASAIQNKGDNLDIHLGRMLF